MFYHLKQWLQLSAPVDAWKAIIRGGGAGGSLE
jgi:hypothetical protein